jgi:hypothetical protein
MRRAAVPANARVEQWLAWEAVLAKASAMVAHGGFGTTMDVELSQLLVGPAFAESAQRVAAAMRELPRPAEVVSFLTGLAR